MNERKRLRWRLVAGAAILLTVLTFTPLVTPVGSTEPALMNVPITMWSGLLVAIGFVLLTYAATRYYPYQKADENEDL